MSSRIALFFFICVIMTPQFNSQTCDLVLRGQVNDADNREHLSFSVITLLPAGVVQQSDEHGNFSFTGLCRQTYSLHISHVGCRDTVVRLELERSSKLLIMLPHSLNALTDVEVLARHRDAPSPVAAEQLDMSRLDRVRGGDLASQLSAVNGVALQRAGPSPGKPVINGMSGNRVLILNNGVRLEGQQWGNEHAPEIDPFTARTISVVKGSAAVAYGSDAIGGVILVQPDPLPDTASVTAEVETHYATNGQRYGGAARVQGYFDKLKHLGWRLQGSVRNSGNAKAPGYYLANTGLTEKNFSYELGYHRKRFGASFYYSQFNSDIGIFSGAHAGNLTDLRKAFASGRPADSLAGFSYAIEAPFQRVNHELVKGQCDIHTGPRSRFNVLYALQYNLRKEFDAHGEEDGEHGEQEAASAFNLTTNYGEVGWEHDYIRSWRGRFGVQAIQQQNIGGGSYFIPNYQSLATGFFATERFVRAHYEIEGGLRYDRKSQQAYFFSGQDLESPALEFDNVSFSVGGIARINSQLKFTLNAGNGWRAPAMNELYSDGLHHGAAAIEKGNASLGKESAINLVAGGEGAWKVFRFRFSAYQYRFSNYICYLPSGTGLSIRGAFPVFTYTQMPAVISGADIDLSLKVASFCELQGRAYWVRGNNSDRKEPLVYMPADHYQGGLRFSGQTKSLVTWYFEPSVLYVAGQNRIPAQLDVIPPPGAYTLVNAEAGSTFSLGRQPLVVSASVSNLLNTSYRDYLDRFRYYADAPGLNVTLRVRMPIVIYDKKTSS